MNLGKTGVGNIVPAMYPIPQNPVTIAWNAYEAAQQKAKGVSGLGDFVPGFVSEPVNPVTGSFYDPQGVGLMVINNPVTGGTRFDKPKQLTRSASKNVLIDSMQRAKFAGPMGSGMGSLDTSSLQAFENSVMSGTSFGVSNLMLVGGGLLAVVLLMGGGRRR